MDAWERGVSVNPTEVRPSVYFRKPAISAPIASFVDHLIEAVRGRSSSASRRLAVTEAQDWFVAAVLASTVRRRGTRRDCVVFARCRRLQGSVRQRWGSCPSPDGAGPAKTRAMGRRHGERRTARTIRPAGRTRCRRGGASRSRRLDNPFLSDEDRAIPDMYWQFASVAAQR
ncbi:hypothetical protein H3V53_25120 [Paraburkholderia bengalensis]|uniref:LysR substrate-binding domain-containing protein n=1 Tax=Paraburkholderia bengalensis TaxID=2747562 RepID=A0ABU8IXR3_9BURK